MVQRIAALLFILGGVVRAASPHLGAIDPPGIQRGADTDVTISGSQLSDARGLLFYSPGIDMLSMDYDKSGKVHARLRAAADCPLGEHDVRLWTATGISELIPFYINPFPNIACSGSNHDIAHAQAVPLNSTVTGVIREEEIDYYSIQAKKGDRLTAQVNGMRLARGIGKELFDPWASIMDAHGRQLAANDDNVLIYLDPLVSVFAPADGAYLVAVRESTWGGNERFAYQLHVGTYPQPVAVYPPGGQAGQNLPVTFIGDIKGPISATFQLPSTPSEPFAAMAVDNGLSAPTPVQMRVSPFPNVLAQPPNGDVAHATAATQPPPVAFNGIIGKPGERDYFRFHATKGTTLDLTVFARQLRSPIDTVMDLWDAKGKHLAGNDDTNGPDSYLRFSVPADGDYCVSIHDQLNRGGPAYVYRVEVVPVGATVSFTLPEFVNTSQDRQTIVVPRGNRYGTTLRVKSDGVDNNFGITFPGLPPGVTVQSGSMAGDLLPVVFEAAPDAVVSATLTEVLAQPADPKLQVAGGYAQTVDFVRGTNDNPYLKSDIHRLAVSVADEAPFRIELVPPPLPILQNGPASLTVTAVRKPGFTAPINVSMLYNPNGVTSLGAATISGTDDSADLALNASADAKPKTWRVAVVASAETGQGTVWTASAFVPLEISKPFVSGQLDRASAVQGQPVTITCHLNQDLPFDGKAHVRLLGLPNKVTAPDVDITSADTQAVFNATTDPASPPGQHRDLFCEVTFEKNGLKMVANIASGGVLRIDHADPKKEVASK